MIALVLACILFFPVGIFMVPRKFQYPLMLTAILAMACGSTLCAIQIFNGASPEIRFEFFSLLGTPVKFIIDPLSAFFILVINTTIFTGALYARGYMAHHANSKSKTELAWHYFNFMLLHASLLGVVQVREGIVFLMFWELMSVATFYLVLFESEKEMVRKAGMKFLVQMHVALSLLMAAFIFCSLNSHLPLGFESVQQYLGSSGGFVVFLLFFAGFGIKAGFIPLHAWLPHAHPAAPSHVSGVMSGVVIKMGVYGILRVLTYMHSNLLAIGLLILAFSIFSGIAGITMAAVQVDYKRLLAYSSIENIGIIGIGVAFGIIGLAINHPILSSLAFAGAFLHIFNHSLFKSLLFYCSGNILLQVHTKDMERLGGLMKKMPMTGLFFLLGALSVSGLPPFNGFISEFMIYCGLFHSISNNNLLMSFVVLGGIIALALMGGLALFAFTKAFGTIFLGNPRSLSTNNAKELPRPMLLPIFLISLAMLAIGIMPWLVINPMRQLVEIFVADTSALQQLSPAMGKISLTTVLLLSFILVLWLVRRGISAKRPHSSAPTWGCGYAASDASKHQYTATSFAEYMVKKARWIAGVKKITAPLHKEDIFPAAIRFKTLHKDVFEHLVITKPVDKLIRLFNRLAVLQTGNIQDYLLYALLFMVLISVLTMLNLI